MSKIETTPEQPYGPRNELLPEDLQAALRALQAKHEEENRSARQEEIKKIQRKRDFFKGDQDRYWSGREKRWKPITSAGLSTKDDENEEFQRFNYKTNVYQANCLITLALLAQNAPSYRFGPQKPSQAEDVATAKAAHLVADYVTDINRLESKYIDLLFYGYNDAGLGSYTRYDVNGEKYGFHDEPIIESVDSQITPDAMVCGACGYREELPEGWMGSDYTPPEICPQCGAMFTPENVQPGVRGPVPKVTGTKQVANGREVVDFVPYIELVRPYYAKSPEDFLWWTWESEVHRAALRQLYPHIAEKIGKATGDAGTGDSVARNARLALTANNVGDAVASLVTYKRTWFRPAAFWDVEKQEIRDQLLTLFRDGCYVAFVGDVYCESRNEKPGKKWAFMHLLPGEGQLREAPGDVLIDVQRRINTEENIQTETYEHGIPDRFVDVNTVEWDAYNETPKLPGMSIPGSVAPGSSMRDAVYDTAPAAVSPQLINHARELRGEISQLLSGNVPEVWGGDTGANDTAHGIAIIKDSAMGRMALLKRAINEFWAQTMLNAVECFRENRSENVEAAILGPSKEFEGKLINLDDLKGGIFVRTEATDAYPTSFTQKRTLLLSLVNSNNPEIAAILGNPACWEPFRTFLGLDESFKFPGEDSRAKQYREISAMLEGVEVPVDLIMDNHPVEAATGREWAATDEGQVAKITNPDGYARVVAHTMQHLEAEAQQQAAAAIMTGQPAGTGAGNEQTERAERPS